MASKEEYKWSLGEEVTLPRTERLLKKSGSRIYHRYINSRYICIREASDDQPGILLKVLGKAMSDDVFMVSSQPFSKDHVDDLFEGRLYYSYPFPTEHEIREVLDIFHNNPNFVVTFEKASMHINPQSKFWINEISSRLVFMKKPRYYDARKHITDKATNDTIAYRLSVVYFTKSELIW